jgi:hypothetical protein
MHADPSDLGALQAFLAFLEGAQIGWIDPPLTVMPTPITFANLAA